jgi:hypothetical protein
VLPRQRDKRNAAVCSAAFAVGNVRHCQAQLASVTQHQLVARTNREGRCVDRKVDGLRIEANRAWFQNLLPRTDDGVLAVMAKQQIKRYGNVMRNDAVGNELPAASGQIIFERVCSFDGAPGPDSRCSKWFRFDRY